MKINGEKKKKLKILLDSLSNDSEKGELAKLDADKVKTVIAAFEEEAAESEENFGKLLAAMSKHTQATNKMTQALLEAFAGLNTTMSTKFDELGRAAAKNKPQDMTGFFKDFGSSLGQMVGHQKKTSDIITNLKWNSSMQIRNKDGSPMEPYGTGSAIATGNGSVTTAGTAVQLPSLLCTRVIIYSNDSNGSLTNGGVIVVGDKSVVASQSTRQGAAIFPANGLEFHVTNLSLLYVDSTDNGAKFHYYVEKNS